jgi:hypothetical protein
MKFYQLLSIVFNSTSESGLSLLVLVLLYSDMQSKDTWFCTKYLSTGTFLRSQKEKKNSCPNKLINVNLVL